MYIYSNNFKIIEMTKKSKFSIFETAKKADPLSEPKALDAALDAIQVYLNLIKNDKEKISHFEDLVNELFSRARNAN